MATVPPVAPVTLPEDANFGDAMKALPTDGMRRFVIAMLDYPHQSQKEWALMAGYGLDNPNTARVRGHQLAHDERIIAAVREEAAKRMSASGIQAVSVVLDIMNDPTASKKDRLRAAEMILNRTGMHETKEVQVKTEKVETYGEKIERAVRLAEKLGLDPQELLGRIGVDLPQGKVRRNALPGLDTPVPDEEVIEDAEIIEDEWSAL
jgi:phage terminase small subunit